MVRTKTAKVQTGEASKVEITMAVDWGIQYERI